MPHSTCPWEFLIVFTVLVAKSTLVFAKSKELILPTPSSPSLGPLCLLEDDRSAVYSAIPEDTLKDTVVVSIPVIGNINKTEPEIRLRLVSGEEFVRLKKHTKELVLQKSIDRDQGNGKFSAVVECSPIEKDSIFPQVNISVYVTVTDVNDNAPEFAQTKFVIRVPEELPEGTPIPLDFHAVDRDQTGPNSHIRYRLSLDPDTPTNSHFLEEELPLSISDPFISQLTVTGRFDYEQFRVLNLLIEAEDGGKPPLNSTAKLRVEILDVDDLNPVFSRDVYFARRVEGSFLMVEPGPIFAFDADQTLNETIVYSLSGEHSLNYSINKLTAVIQLLGNSIVPAKLVIYANQLIRPERNATAFLEISNDDRAVNSNRNFVYFINVPSSLAIGTEVVRPDISKNIPIDSHKFAYEIASEDSVNDDRHDDAFSVDRATGALSLRRRLSPGGQYVLKIVAEGAPAEELSSESTEGSRYQITANVLATVHERLSALDASPPVFDQEEYIFEIKERGSRELEEVEEIEDTVEVGQIKAHPSEWKNVENEAKEDGFDGSNERFPMLYSLLNFNDQFHIDPETGVLTMFKHRLTPHNNTKNWSESTSTELTQNVTHALPLSFELVIMVEDAEGRRNFAKCTVLIKSTLNNALGTSEPEVKRTMTTVLLGGVCFFLLVANAVSLTLLFGKRISSAMAPSYNSVSQRFTGRHNDWMVNNALREDPGVTIVSCVANPKPVMHISDPIINDFYTDTTASAMSSHRYERPIDSPGSSVKF